MSRVVSIFLPDLPTDRIRRDDPSIADDQPIAVIARSGAKRWVSSADAAAKKMGVRVGMPATKAQALFRGLKLVDADPAADAVALERIALWALEHYSPIVAVDGTDGLVLDTEGADHLQGGEQPMVTKIFNAFHAKKLTARVAIADTWGTAHACARAISGRRSSFPRARLSALSRGFLSRCCGSRTRSSPTFAFWASRPSANFRRRRARRSRCVSAPKSAAVSTRCGLKPEPIDPIRTAEIVEVFRNFQEPKGAAETINKYVGRLVIQLVGELEKRGLGVRRTDLIVHKVDNTIQAIRTGTAKPARDVAWLTKLFRDRTEKIEPGFGIEKLSLVAVAAEPLEEEQRSSSLVEDETTDITPLIDIFGNRGQRVFRVAPVASDVPERSVQRISRDYFLIENEKGERFWIYRDGDGVDLETGSHKWFMHGLFA